MILSNKPKIIIVVMPAFLSVIAASYAVKRDAVRWDWATAMVAIGVEEPLVVGSQIRRDGTSLGGRDPAVCCIHSHYIRGISLLNC